MEIKNTKPDEFNSTESLNVTSQQPHTSLLYANELYSTTQTEANYNNHGKHSAGVLYEEKHVLKGHKKAVSSVQFSPDGKLIASCSSDATIRIWDSYTAKLHHILEGHLAGISAISWSPDCKHIASGSDDKTIRLWNAITGQAHPMPLVGHHNYVFSLTFSPKGNILVSGSYDEAVFFWDIRAARIMRTLPAHSDPVRCVDFVFDGTLIVSCASDGLIRIWDAATGQCLRTMIHEDNIPVTCVKFSPNGKYVLAWTLNSSIRLWDYVKGRCLKTYQGHLNLDYCLTGCFGIYGIPLSDYTSNGSCLNSLNAHIKYKNAHAFIVSGSEDSYIYIWDVISKNLLQRLSGHSGTVFAVHTHPNQPMLVSCGEDCTVRVWGLAKN